MKEIFNYYRCGGKGYSIVFLFTLLLIFLLTASSHPDTRVVRVGAFNYYPAIFKDSDGRVKGFYVDVLTEIGKKEDIRFEYVYGSWNDGLDKVMDGRVDILTSVARTAEREKYLDYCKEPLLTVWGELYTRRDSDLDNIYETDGKRIGVMKRDFNAASFMDIALKLGLKCVYVEYPGFDEVFRAVADGKVDAGVANVTYGAAKQHEYGLRSTGVVFNPFDIYFAALKGENRDILDMLDTYLHSWRHTENSAYIKARQRWSHGNTGKIEIIPDWLLKTIYALLLLILLVSVFAVLLKLQVARGLRIIKEREARLLESEEIFNQFLLHSPIYVFFKDSEIRSIRLSANYEKMLGRPVGEIIGKSMFELFPEELAEKMIADDTRVLDEGRVITIDEELDGRYYTTIKFPFGLPDNRRYVAGFTIDITGRKLAEDRIRVLLEEKELLLKEVHHRIKNNMNTIKGLLSLQIDAEKDPSVIESLEDAERRVQSMIMLYDRLYVTDNYRELPVKDYLESLVAEAVSSFNRGNIVKIETSIQDFIMSLQTLSSVGIIVNELVTNIMKHALKESDDGLIKVAVILRNRSVIISVADNGPGIPGDISFENSTGFGLTLVKMLVDQLEGNIRIERGEGTRIEMEFSIDG